MEIISKLEFILLLCAIAINALLAWVVYTSDKKSDTNRLYTVLSLNISVWLIINYISHTTLFLSNSIYWIRLSLFFALPMSMLFFLFAHTIPEKVIRISKRQLVLLFALTGSAMLLTISPYTFTEVKLVNGSPLPVTGPGIIYFGFISITYSLFAAITFFRKYKSSTGEQRLQFKYIMYGVLSMIGLITTTIFLPVIFFSNNTFLGLLPLYTLIFLTISAYVIIGLHLFKVKLIATEALFFALWIGLFSQALGRNSVSDLFVGFIMLFGLTVLGYLLINGVKKEVEQKELLEALTQELGDANEKLQSLDKARAEFISIASHQLRTPPSTVKWYMSSVLSGDFGRISAKVLEPLKKVNETNNHLISLIEDMLNVSRIERGKMEFLFEQTNVQDLAKQAFDQLIPMASDKKLKFDFDSPKKPLPEIMADKEKLKQVMNNLTDNALKYTKSGSVKVKIYEKDGNIFFEVTDSGKGISKEDRESIFQKYTRGKESVKQSAGLGLGLYVAKIIIEQHKGKIWAESPGEGQGSTFAFSVPIKNDLKATTLVDLATQK